MGRPRSFDEDVVLDEAIGQFWLTGYAGTSMRDLAAAMGLTSASLYNAFGDKRHLFALALQRYLDQLPRRRMTALDAAPDPLGAMRSFFTDLIAVSLSDQRGCMLINSAVEVAPFDPELRIVIRAGLAEIEAGLQRVIVRARARGMIAATQDEADLAKLLLATVISIRVLARTTADRDLLVRIVDGALAQLQPVQSRHPN